jgi:phosphoglycolate phosphatase
VAPLVLFDIDGTLLGGASGLHAAAFAAALAERYGAPDPFVTGVEGRVTCGGRPLGGRLDAEIAGWCLDAAGIDETRHDAEVGPYCDLVVARYLAATDTGGIAGTVLPGVEATLAALRDAGAPCGVVTGNLEPIAARKLAASGLERFFSRGGQLVGGFGAPPARARTELFPRTPGRARAVGDRFDGLVYVGDTPLAAAAAASAGVRFVGVATGRHPAGELAALDAGPVFATLEDPAVVGVLLGVRSGSRAAPPAATAS